MDFNTFLSKLRGIFRIWTQRKGESEALLAEGQQQPSIVVSKVLTVLVGYATLWSLQQPSLLQSHSGAFFNCMLRATQASRCYLVTRPLVQLRFLLFRGFGGFP